MNNFLDIDIEKVAAEERMTSFGRIYHIDRRTKIRKWFWGLLLLSIVILLLPWTQNIRARGAVTTLRQEDRPQQVNAIIAGTALKWFVKEGDFVKSGDTILQMGEVRVDYFDSRLLQRTQEQIKAKQETTTGYRNKANATVEQSHALAKGRDLKLEWLENKLAQQQLKVQSDEASVQAAQTELDAYKRQIDAAKIMLDSGAISLTEFERRKLNYQNALAKTNTANNQLLQSRQELTNLRIEKNSAVQEYADKIAKADGERFAALSSAASTEAELAKLENEYANYYARNKYYFIVASQGGQITKARKAGIGEFIKEGEMVVEIVPDKAKYAVEMFIQPMDLPLISVGQEIRFVFDGFPAIVFSGWPSGSFGTFGGRVVAVETSISANGKYRILVAEDPNDRPWPAQLRIGNGANGIALLKDVSIIYELWRNINGFPPEYYQYDTTTTGKDKSGQ